MAGKIFQFRLEAVLKLRRHETELARRELALVVTKVLEARDTLNRAELQLEELLVLAPNGSNLSAMRRLAEMRSGAIDFVHRAKAVLTEGLDVELKAREAVHARLRREEALENLKTHQRDEFEEMQRKAEQLMLDEFAIIGHVRNKLSTS